MNFNVVEFQKGSFCFHFIFLLTSFFTYLVVGCSHQRAWEYFIESVKWPQAFPVNGCEPSKTFAICKDGNGRAFMGMSADRR